MLCQICKKNEATIHIQEVVGGQKKAVHLCQDCSENKQNPVKMFGGMNLSDILYNITENMPPEILEGMELAMGAGLDAKDLPAPIVCSCGWDTKKFQKSGRLGCEKCYQTFSNIILPALPNMHKGVIHVGKHANAKLVEKLHKEHSKQQKEKDKKIKRKETIKSLQSKLNECIKKEYYEEAAILRDKINDIKKEAKKKK